MDIVSAQKRFSVERYHYERLVKNTVLLKVKFKKKKKRGKKDDDGWSSGFYVGGGLILTAAHCVKRAKKIKANDINGMTFNCSVLVRNKKTDIAFLSVEGFEKASRCDVSLRLVSVFPCEDIFSISNMAMGYDSIPFNFMRGFVTKASWCLDEFSRFFVDMSATSGASGSPVFDLDGNLVGIILGGNDYLNYCATTSDIFEVYKEAIAKKVRD